MFIFILLLSFFALQYHATTSALTKASDPQTTALLQMADDLQPKTVDLQIDYDKKVVCIPANALSKDGAAASTDKRCFAYSAVQKASAASGPSADESREALTAFLKGDLASKTPVQADAANGTLTFTADDLFSSGQRCTFAQGGDHGGAMWPNPWPRACHATATARRRQLAPARRKWLR